TGRARRGARRVVGRTKLRGRAGKATRAPPIGPALGQRGLNIMEFCKAFNAQTQSLEAGLPVPVVITAYQDKSFSFVVKTPPATVLIKKAAKIESGSARPHTDKVGKITRAQAEEIAKAKMPDLTAADLDAAVRPNAGRARGTGRRVGGLGDETDKAAEGARWPRPGRQALSGHGRVPDRQEGRDREVRRIGRRRGEPRHRREEVGPGSARLGRAPRRHRKEGGGRGVYPGG